MTTTVILDDNIHSAATAIATRQRITFSDLVEKALRQYLTEYKSEPSAGVPLPVFRGDGRQAGVNLDDMGSVYDKMDGIP